MKFFQGKVANFNISHRNREEFRGLVEEIFKKHQYYFEAESKSPVIVDVGAHIGLSTLYFKNLYPEARIVAVEPLRENAELLRLNMSTNVIRDVEIVEVALAASSGKATLYFDSEIDDWYSTAGFTEGAWNGRQTSQSVEVETIALSSLLDEPVDLLKMDIEGAELAVLKEANSKLRRVKRIFLEHHPMQGNSLEKIVKLLESLGFGVEVTTDKKIGLSLVEAVV